MMAREKAVGLSLDGVSRGHYSLAGINGKERWALVDRLGSVGDEW